MRRFITILFLLTIAGCNTLNNPANTIKCSQWTYSYDIDKMSSDTIQYAETLSPDLFSIYPGSKIGKAVITLTLVRQSSRYAVMLRTSNGAFYTSGAETVRIKFGPSTPITYHYTKPNDGSNDRIYIYPAKDIIERLKYTSNIVVEVSFYNSGNKQIEFDTGNLDFNL